MYTIEIGQNLPYEASAIYIEAHADAYEQEHVIVDLTKTNYIHSSFIGFLLNLIAHKKKYGGDITLQFGKNSNVYNQLNRIGVIDYYTELKVQNTFKWRI